MMDAEKTLSTNYNLDKDSASEIDKFTRYVADPRSVALSTPYNLLIDSDNKSERSSFTQELAEWLFRNNRSTKRRVCICSESEIVEHINILATWLRPYFACIIEADGSADSRQVKQIASYIESTPTTIFIVSTTPSDIDQRLKPDDHLYYRVLPYHIHIGDVNGTILTERLIRMLESNDFTVSDDFKAAMHTYNSVVYPKADLKNESYLQDLFRRVINNHLGSGNTSQCIDGASVPYYKNLSTTTTPGLDISALPLEEGPLNTAHASGNNYNVLFLALSTFPKTDNSGKVMLDRCSFSLTAADGSAQEYSYYYQLEPVPRMLSIKLSEESGEQIDKLILFCSRETKEEAQVLINNQSASISPCEFLKKRLAHRLPLETNGESSIYEIEVDTKSPVAGIRDTVRYIRNLKEAHPNLRLYVDRHGGIRSIQSSVNAMLSLLKAEINIAKIYDLTFSTRTKIGTIKEADSHDLYDFVSGINEFTNYGRIKSLEEFYGEDNRNDLMQHISTISEGIQLCDIATFEQGISDISAYYASNRAISSDSESSSSSLNSDVSDKSHEYLSLFEDKIFEDYKNILEAQPHRKVLEEIEWCRRKGFYQQALTLIESRMPAELKACGAYSYDNSLADYADDIEKSRKFKYQTSVDFIFNQTVMFIRNDTSVADEIRNAYHYSDGSTPTFQEKNAYFRKCYIRDGIYRKYHAVTYRNAKGKNIATIWCTHASFKKVPNADEPAISTVHFTYQDSRELFSFLHLHAAFKELRNQANHASREGICIPLEAIDQALQFYYAHGKNIEEYAEKQTLSV